MNKADLKDKDSVFVMAYFEKDGKIIANPESDGANIAWTFGFYVDLTQAAPAVNFTITGVEDDDFDAENATPTFAYTLENATGVEFGAAEGNAVMNIKLQKDGANQDTNVSAASFTVPAAWGLQAGTQYSFQFQLCKWKMTEVIPAVGEEGDPNYTPAVPAHLAAEAWDAENTALTKTVIVTVAGTQPEIQLDTPTNVKAVCDATAKTITLEWNVTKQAPAYQITFTPGQNNIGGIALTPIIVNPDADGFTYASGKCTYTFGVPSDCDGGEYYVCVASVVTTGGPANREITQSTREECDQTALTLPRMTEIVEPVAVPEIAFVNIVASPTGMNVPMYPANGTFTFNVFDAKVTGADSNALLEVTVAAQSEGLNVAEKKDIINTLSYKYDTAAGKHGLYAIEARLLHLDSTPWIASIDSIRHTVEVSKDKDSTFVEYDTVYIVARSFFYVGEKPEVIPTVIFAKANSDNEQVSAQGGMWDIDVTEEKVDLPFNVTGMTIGTDAWLLVRTCEVAADTDVLSTEKFDTIKTPMEGGNLAPYSAIYTMNNLKDATKYHVDVVLLSYTNVNGKDSVAYVEALGGYIGFSFYFYVAIPNDKYTLVEYVGEVSLVEGAPVVDYKGFPDTINIRETWEDFLFVVERKQISEPQGGIDMGSRALLAAPAEQEEELNGDPFRVEVRIYNLDGTTPIITKEMVGAEDENTLLTVIDVNDIDEACRPNDSVEHLLVAGKSYAIEFYLKVYSETEINLADENSNIVNGGYVYYNTDGDDKPVYELRDTFSIINREIPEEPEEVSISIPGLDMNAGVNKVFADPKNVKFNIVINGMTEDDTIGKQYAVKLSCIAVTDPSDDDVDSGAAQAHEFIVDTLLVADSMLNPFKFPEMAGGNYMMLVELMRPDTARTAEPGDWMAWGTGDEKVQLRVAFMVSQPAPYDLAAVKQDGDYVLTWKAFGEELDFLVITNNRTTKQYDTTPVVDGIYDYDDATGVYSMSFADADAGQYYWWVQTVRAEGTGDNIRLIDTAGWSQLVQGNTFIVLPTFEADSLKTVDAGTSWELTFDQMSISTVRYHVRIHFADGADKGAVAYEDDWADSPVRLYKDEEHWGYKAAMVPGRKYYWDIRSYVYKYNSPALDSTEWVSCPDTFEMPKRPLSIELDDQETLATTFRSDAGAYISYINVHGGKIGTDLAIIEKIARDGNVIELDTITTFEYNARRYNFSFGEEVGTKDDYGYWFFKPGAYKMQWTLCALADGVVTPYTADTMTVTYEFKVMDGSNIPSFELSAPWYYSYMDEDYGYAETLYDEPASFYGDPTFKLSLGGEDNMGTANGKYLVIATIGTRMNGEFCSLSDTLTTRAQLTYKLAEGWTERLEPEGEGGISTKWVSDYDQYLASFRLILVDQNQWLDVTPDDMAVTFSFAQLSPDSVIALTGVEDTKLTVERDDWDNKWYLHDHYGFDAEPLDVTNAILGYNEGNVQVRITISSKGEEDIVILYGGTDPVTYSYKVVLPSWTKPGTYTMKHEVMMVQNGGELEPVMVNGQALVKTIQLELVGEAVPDVIELAWDAKYHYSEWGSYYGDIIDEFASNAQPSLDLDFKVNGKEPKWDSFQYYVEIEEYDEYYKKSGAKTHFGYTDGTYAEIVPAGKTWTAEAFEGEAGKDYSITIALMKPGVTVSDIAACESNEDWLALFYTELYYGSEYPISVDAVFSVVEPDPERQAVLPTLPDASVEEKNVTFSWGVTEGCQYQFEVFKGEELVWDGMPVADADMLDITIADGRMSFTHEFEDGEYTWHVRGVVTSQYGAVMSSTAWVDGNPFTVGEEHHEDPVAVAPTNLARTVDGQNVTFTWTAKEGAAYQIMVMKGNEQIAFEPAENGTHTIEGLEAGNYTWKMRGVAFSADVNNRAMVDSTAWVDGPAFEIEKVANMAEKLANVNIYPNPTAGQFTVNVPVKANVEIFGTNGTVVERRANVDGKVVFNLNHSGIYFVRIATANNAVVKRVIVR